MFRYRLTVGSSSPGNSSGRPPSFLITGSTRLDSFSHKAALEQLQEVWLRVMFRRFSWRRPEAFLHETWRMLHGAERLYAH